METINTGASEVNIKREIYHPFQTIKIEAEDHNYDHTLLETSKSENLEAVVSIIDTVIDCDIGNNEQTTSVTADHEPRGKSKSATIHIIVKHNQTWYKCSSCSYKSKYKSRLKLHFRLEHNDSPIWYQCNFCSRKVKSKHNLLVHFQTQHDTDPMLYQCHHCGFETKYKHWLSQHIKIIHYKSSAFFRCTYCKFRTVRESTLKKHVEQHKLLVCALCDYRTPKKSCLNHHMKLHQSKIPKWYQCRFCSFKAKHEANLTVHVERRHDLECIRKEGIEWFHCDLCEFKSTSQWYLEFHSKYSHTPTDELDQCESKMGETTVLNDTKEEKCANKCEFKIDSTSDANDSDVYRDMIHYIEVKPDLVLNFNDNDAQTDHHIDNCDSTIDLTSDSCNNDTQYGQTDTCDFKHDALQNFNENTTAHEDYIKQSVIEVEQQPYVTLNYDENRIQSFQCDLCEFTSSSQWCLECHIKYTHNVTNDENPVWYQCCYCNYKTELESTFLVHFHTEHNKNPVWYQCHCCGFGTKYKHNLARHMEISHKTASFQCEFCKFRTAKESSLNKHVEQHKLLVCYVCDYRTPKKKYLRHHVKLHLRTECEQNAKGYVRRIHNKNQTHDSNPAWYYCYQCEYETTRKHLLSRHIKNIHKTCAWFTCKFCEFRAVNESSWKTHVEQTHKLFVCSVCDYKTLKKRNLMHHEKLRHNKSFKWYRCQFCNFKTKYQQSLKGHVERKHYKDLVCKEGIEWFRCDSCEFKSTSLWYLEFHSKYSHNQTDELDQCEFKMGETTDLLNSDRNDAKKEGDTNKREFKINLALHTCDSDTQQENN